MTELVAPRFICIGTHHKTGTIWMRTVFRILARRLKLAFVYAFPKWRADTLSEPGRAVLYNWSSKLPDAVLARSDARTLHMIRDPRDVLVSGMRYHMRSTTRDEKFLHRPRPDLDGRSYQDHMLHLDTDDDRLLFEMDNKHSETLDQMLAWDYDRRNAVELRYEDLMQDTDCTLFGAALSKLGFQPAEIDLGKRVFWDNSLFGGLTEDTRRTRRVEAHISSGRVKQWRHALPRTVAERYAARHGDALVRLGYEPHPTAWLSEIRDAC